MAKISARSWDNYIKRLRKLSDKAADATKNYINTHDLDSPVAMQEFIDYAYALATKYGEGSATLACEMYEAMAELSGVVVPPAIPAETAEYSEVAKSIYGTRLQSEEVTSGAIGRLVKMASVDTMMQNALRDGAEWAWIPRGDTCAFCLTLASRGWQKASKNAIKNGHAEHVHANCDCTYAVRFNQNVNVEGYEPEEYLDMYYDADGNTPTQKINALRREFYAKNKETINAQKRSAYAKRIERESSRAEEINVD